MSTATLQPPGVPPPLVHWTRERYRLAIDNGVFDEDEKVELIGGQIRERPMPQKEAHANAIGALQETLGAVFGPGFWIRIQLPLAISADGEPEPDIAVVKGSYRDYKDGHPTTALLVVEVADTSVLRDREYKSSLYAAGGIPEYWVLNVSSAQLEVFRRPVADPGTAFGFTYADVDTLRRGDSVEPVSAPTMNISVADLLP